MYQPVFMATSRFFRNLFHWDSTEPTTGKPFNSFYEIVKDGMGTLYLLVFNVVVIGLLIMLVVKGVRLSFADERERAQAKSDLKSQIIGLIALFGVVNIVSQVILLLM